jgi:anti-anti-sigma factor
VARVRRTHLLDPRDSQQFGDDLEELLSRHGIKRVALNLGKVQFMSTSAIAVLVRFHTRLQKENGRLQLCHVGPDIREVLKVMHMDELFFISERTRDAVKALRESG